MKTSLLVLASVLSIASIAVANAAPHKPVVVAKDDAVHRCNVNLWPGFSATPCQPPPGISNYGACLSFTMDKGWTNAEGRWYCSSVHFKT